ncbi:hypothetical protein LguiA_026235 [Lonicera macranthoides]
MNGRSTSKPNEPSYCVNKLFNIALHLPNSEQPLTSFFDSPNAVMHHAISPMPS